jgi:drug/metabolite transporter (DMT)-like permease
MRGVISVVCDGGERVSIRRSITACSLLRKRGLEPKSATRKGHPMLLYYLPFGIAVISSCLYHVSQKAISPAVNPVVSLLVTYLAAFVFTFALFILYPIRSGVVAELSKVNWASIVLAVAIVGLEIGFLLAYRVGWSVSVTGVAANAAAALLLIPTGLFLFQEKPSVINIVGVFVCILGLVMVNSRS